MSNFIWILNGKSNYETKKILTVILIILTVILSASYLGINEQKALSTDINNWESLFSSINDTILWSSKRSSFFPKEGWSFENGDLKLSVGRVGGDLITNLSFV